MRRYDVVFIALSNLPDTEVSEIIERYQNMVTERKGLIIKVEKWGKRKLAYEIRKQNMGFYVLFDFAGDSHIIDELERNLKIDDKILKFLTVKTSEEITAAEVDEIVAAAAKAGQAAAEGAAESAEPKMIIPEGADKTAAAEASPASADTKEEGK
ncbi:MAG TPA: 30S ribosomal protein S6 [Syntrophales bacterium]|nr:30S ribosomal protein S6 [Syntrophales bacterium]HPX57024.1 30S ribosomal protein S6 [Syntrophales bacterium]HQA82819.1 30S ribosomal protein S6 [Syntrophales bacterium]